MNNHTIAKKFTYNIMDELGKIHKVEFVNEYQLHTWLTMEEKLFSKKYTIIGIQSTDN